MDFFEQNSFRHSFERWKGFKTSLVDFHIREKLLERAIKKVNSNQLAIDLGCGDGIFTNILSKYFQKVVSIDKNHSFISKNRDNVRESGDIEFYCGDIIAPIPILVQKANFIFCNHVLEYIEDETAFWDSIARISSSGTVICIVTKNGYWNIWKIIKLLTLIYFKDPCPKQIWRKLDKNLPSSVLLKECFFLDVRLPVHISDLNDYFDKKVGFWDNIGARISMKSPQQKNFFSPFLRLFAWHIAVIAVVK